jgi:hypothetical protein
VKFLAPPKKYDYLFLKGFENQLNKFKDGQTRSIIQRKLEKVLEDPYHFSRTLSGCLSGNREIKVLVDLKIIITICEECRKQHHMSTHKCKCDDIPVNTIICWWIGNHDEMAGAQTVTQSSWVR